MSKTTTSFVRYFFFLIAWLTAFPMMADEPAIGVNYPVTTMSSPSWCNEQIPASAFNSQAVAAKITVKGATYIAFSHIVNYTSTDLKTEGGVFERNKNNNRGVSLLVTGDLLAEAKAGGLYVRTDGATGITLTVKNLSTTTDPDEGSGGSGESGGSGSDDDPTSLSYKIAHQMQLTDVPTLYITIDGVGSTDADLDKALYKDRTTGVAPYSTAVILVKDDGSDKSDRHLTEFRDTVQIKVRGNSTANPTNGKKAYRLKFPKKHKHDLLGSGYNKRNWTLLANDFDHSMIRNALSYHLEKEVGMDFCPGYKFVDLVINGNYRGTYQVSDHVETGANRVDINEDNGLMVEFQGRGDMLDKPLCFSKNGLLINIKNPEPADETDEAQVNAVIAPVQDWFVNTWAPLWESTSAYSRDHGWRSVNDEESLLKFWIVTELTGDYDGWMTTKAYKDAGSNRLCYGPVWDKDLAYGNCNYEKSDALVSNNGNASSLVNYLNNDLLKDPLFATRLKTTLDSLLSHGLLDRLTAKVDELAAIVAQTEALNNTKFPRNVQAGIELNNYETYDETVAQLKNYLQTRFATVQALTDDLYTVATTNDGNTVSYNPEANIWDTGFYGKTGKLTTVSETNRTYKAGQWNTFCVPFDLTIDQLKAVFGTSVVAKEHTAIAADGKTMVFTDVTGGYLKSGYPYLIKFSGSDIANPTFQNVIITDCASQSNGVVYNGRSVTCDSLHFFTGTLFQASYLSTATDYVFTDDQYLTDASLAKTTSATVLGARAFIRVPEGETPAISLTSTPEVPTRAQLTDVPTIYLDGTCTDSWSKAEIEVFDKDGVLPANLTGASLEFQYQGSGSGHKDSYKLKFAAKTALLPSGRYKQWVLASNDDDPSMARNALTTELGKAVGMHFQPGYRFVDLYLNDVYQGTYQITDRVKVEKGRALVSGGNKDNDWLVQLADNGEVEEEGDVYIPATATTPNIIPKNPDTDDYLGDQTKIDSLTTAMRTWFNDTLFADMEQYANHDQLFAWYIAQEILCTYKGLSAVDVYRSTTASDRTAYFGPLWDSERSFDNNSKKNKKHILDMSDLDTAGSYNGLITEFADYKVMRRILKNLWLEPWFAKGVWNKWQTLYGSSAAGNLETTLETRLDDIAAQLSQTQEKNYAATTEGGAGHEKEGFTDYSETITAIKTYLKNRFPYLDAKFRELQSDRVLRYNVVKTDALAAWAMSDGKTRTVLLKNRKDLHGGEWNALCLPFDLDEAAITAVFGQGVQVKAFSSITRNGENFSLNFTPVTRMEHGVPYIVKPVADVAEASLRFADVTLNLEDAQIVTRDGCQFVGTLQKTPLASDGTCWVLMRNNVVKRQMAAAQLHGCRAYFIIPATSEAQSLSIGDETVDLIDHVAADDATATKVYNLQGQLVGTSLSALPRGIYIVNGKKFTK